MLLKNLWLLRWIAWMINKKPSVFYVITLYFAILVILKVLIKILLVLFLTVICMYNWCIISVLHFFNLRHMQILVLKLWKFVPMYIFSFVLNGYSCFFSITPFYMQDICVLHHLLASQAVIHLFCLPTVCISSENYL